MYIHSLTNQSYVKREVRPESYSYPELELEFSLVPGLVAAYGHLSSQLHGERARDNALGVAVGDGDGVLLSQLEERQLSHPVHHRRHRVTVELRPGQHRAVDAESVVSVCHVERTHRGMVRDLQSYHDIARIANYTHCDCKQYALFSTPGLNY